MSFQWILMSCQKQQPSTGVLGDLKICDKFTAEHPCRNVISLKLLYNFIEITLRHGCSPVNLLHIFRTTFLKNTSEGLLLPWSWLVLSQSIEDHCSSTVNRGLLSTIRNPLSCIYCFSVFIFQKIICIRELHD